MNESKPSTVDFECRFDPERVKKPSTLLALPDLAFERIAQITLLWGTYEAAEIDFLEIMVIANGANNETWRRLSGPRRRSRLLAEAKAAFAQEPNIISYLTDLENDADRLSHPRNAIVHGQMTIAIPPQETPHYVMQVTGTGLYGDEKPFDFTPDDLEQLFYDIAHLAGRACQLIEPNEKAHPPLTSLDKLTLQDFLKKHRPSLPMRSTRRARPLTFALGGGTQ